MLWKFAVPLKVRNVFRDPRHRTGDEQTQFRVPISLPALGDLLPVAIDIVEGLRNDRAGSLQRGGPGDRPDG